MSFTTIYRTGGTSRVTWRRCAPVGTRAAAEVQADACEKAGYKALVFNTKQLDAVGLPTGWAAELPRRRVVAFPPLGRND